ncbi:MAG: M4 family metallopeptidase [Nocardioidaceae bacterium]|nr:M4 family metallopeptidase [Nocardioidaceae bacterium]
MTWLMALHTFLPPYLLQTLADSAEGDVAACGRATLVADGLMRERRTGPPRPPRRTALATGRFTVHTAGNTEQLPGTPARADGADPVGDVAVDEAYAATEQVWALFEEVYGRSSVDGRGTPIVVTVHYGQGYVNAFWDGQQLVFGDGDGQVFDRFTKPPDVLAHEFTHGVTQYTANLVYQGQSGALNESVSDVFAALTTQRVAGQTADQADWLIGKGLFLPGVQATALRSMSAPGTAYDDPRLGRDPQVGSMADYVETTDDNGGVHINSGIPNRAFHLAATTMGGQAWEDAGRTWYAALTGDQVTPDVDFAGFAAATVAAAGDLFGADSSQVAAVREGWAGVGVVPGVATAPAGASSVPVAAGRVVVRRSGGFVGAVRTGEVALDADPVGPEVRSLLDQVDLATVSGTSTPAPDRFVYTVEIDGQPFDVPEQAMTPALSRVVNLVLGDDAGPLS